MQDSAPVSKRCALFYIYPYGSHSPMQTQNVTSAASSFLLCQPVRLLKSCLFFAFSSLHCLCYWLSQPFRTFPTSLWSGWARNSTKGEQILHCCHLWFSARKGRPTGSVTGCHGDMATLGFLPGVGWGSLLTGNQLHNLLSKVSIRINNRETLCIMTKEDVLWWKGFWASQWREYRR